MTSPSDSIIFLREAGSRLNALLAERDAAALDYQLGGDGI